MAPFAQQACDIAQGSGGRHAFAAGDLHGGDVLVARHAPPVGAQRRQYNVVLIHAGGGLAFRLQQADDLAGDFTEAYFFANGVAAAKQIFTHRLTQQADRRATAQLAIAETAAIGQRPVANAEITIVDAVNAGQPTAVTGHHRQRTRGGRRNGGHGVDVACYCFGVGQLELWCFGTLHTNALTGTHNE